MSRLEKHAWYNLGVFALASVFYAIVFPFTGALPATGCFGLCGLWGIGHLLFYPKGRWNVVLDEREQMIMRRAWQVGHGLFWGLFVLAVMLTWSLNRGRMVSISSDILPLFVIGGMIVVVLSQSVAMLILSRTGLKYAET